MKTWATEEDWARHRRTISDLYTRDNETLAEVMATMGERHGFYAT